MGVRGSIIFIAALLLFAAGCSNEGGTGYDIDQDQDLYEEAVQVYKQSCIQCHGTDLEGRVGDRSNLTQVGSSLSKEQIMDAIKQGPKIMPAFEELLTPEEIEALAEWLKTKK
ncbi:c-type cytochrome [Marinicrinis lubricantis]|uniref:C-type cytochrome n=1 Tax=Marinicrinis lubricantis TaxID=2086470 RepID=A0ABW1IS31_9BACL